MPRRQRNRATVLAHGESGTSRSRWPSSVSRRTISASMAGAHQISADVLPRANQVAQRLFLAAGDPHGVQPVDHQQPHQSLGVASVGLDAILRRALDLARRRHHAPDPRVLQPPRQREPGGPGLIGHSRRPRQPGAERDELAGLPRQPPNAELPRLAIDRRRQDLRCVHVEPRPAANLCHVGTPMIAVGAQAAPGPSTRAPHARVSTLTPTADDQTDGPYGLGIGRSRRGRRIVGRRLLGVARYAGPPYSGRR